MEDGGGDVSAKTDEQQVKCQQDERCQQHPPAGDDTCAPHPEEFEAARCAQGARSAKYQDRNSDPGNDGSGNYGGVDVYLHGGLAVFRLSGYRIGQAAQVFYGDFHLVSVAQRADPGRRASH